MLSAGFMSAWGMAAGDAAAVLTSFSAVSIRYPGNASASSAGTITASGEMLPRFLVIVDGGIRLFIGAAMAAVLNRARSNMTRSQLFGMTSATLLPEQIPAVRRAWAVCAVSCSSSPNESVPVTVMSAGASPWLRAAELTRSIDRFS